MTVYSVSDDYNTPIYFATKREAVAHAKDMAKGEEWDVEGKFVTVERVRLMPITKALIVRLINVSGGYVDSTEVVVQFPIAKKGGA